MDKQHLQLIKKTERETQPKGHSPHARDNQLQVGTRGDPIRPLVAEILIFTYRSAGGVGKPLLVFVALWLEEEYRTYRIRRGMSTTGA